jgi:hypothetical protein
MENMARITGMWLLTPKEGMLILEVVAKKILFTVH